MMRTVSRRCVCFCLAILAPGIPAGIARADLILDPSVTLGARAYSIAGVTQYYAESGGTIGSGYGVAAYHDYASYAVFDLSGIREPIREIRLVGSLAGFSYVLGGEIADPAGITVDVRAAGPAAADPQSIYEAATGGAPAASFGVDNGVDPFGFGALGGDFDIALEPGPIAPDGRLALGLQGYGYGAGGHGPLATFARLQLRVITPRSVPEPASVTALGIGAVAVLGLGRKRVSGAGSRGC
jgi:hypothetical protein